MKPRFGLAVRATPGVPPPGAPVAPAAALKPAVEPAAAAPVPPAAAAEVAAPVGAPTASEGAPVVAAPSPASGSPGGLVVPLFREGSDSRKTTIGVIVFAAVLVFGGAIGVVRMLTRPSPEKVAAATAKAPTPSAANAETATPTATPKANAAPASAAAVPAPTSSGGVYDLLALGPPPSSKAPESDLVSSRAFRVIPEPGAHPDMIRFVEEAKVSGVTVGNPPRALINGRLVRGGALVEPKLGIVFLGLDTGRRTLIFRSSTGDVVRLEY